MTSKIKIKTKIKVKTKNEHREIPPDSKQGKTKRNVAGTKVAYA